MATTGIATISDHDPVTMKLKLKGEVSGRRAWRINEDIWEDKVEKTIRTEIDQNFLINETPDLSKATIWEAHKAVIRGQLIAIGARKKKEREIALQKSLKEIYDLEQRHKKQVEKDIQRALIIKRELLKDLMEQGV